MQRFLDILLSVLALLALSVLLIPIVIILRFTGEGEIFFLQERVGKNNKIFKLYKFATMLKNSPNIGTGTVTVKNDSRILPVGKFLRKTKINELPQLINVFLGDMSVVGPRPQALRCFNAFPKNIQDIIVKVKPGLSGFGSIIFRNEENILTDSTVSIDFYDCVIAPYKGQVEAWYVNHQTLIIYFSVIFITVWVVLFPNTDVIWRMFKSLPAPPDELKVVLNYP